MHDISGGSFQTVFSFLELKSFQTYASAMRSLAVPPATPLGYFTQTFWVHYLSLQALFGNTFVMGKTLSRKNPISKMFPFKIVTENRSSTYKYIKCNQCRFVWQIDLQNINMGLY